MKNFLKFLLVFVGVILVYVYNNPEVISKYKDASQTSAESDSTVTVDESPKDTAVVAVDKTPDTAVAQDKASDTVASVDKASDTVVVKKEKKYDAEVQSKRPIVREKNTIDSASVKALKCHFILEKEDGVDFYYPKNAPNVNGKRYSNLRCFYTYVCVFKNGQVSTNLTLNMTVTDSEKLDITKLFIMADGYKYEIKEKAYDVHSGYSGGFAAIYYIDLSKHIDMAWALYYAKSAKVVYESNGVKKEMAITSEELQYIRYSMDFYRSWRRCPKCVF